VIIGFAADQLLNPRKGADFLWQALGMRDATPPVQLLVFGAGELPNSIEGVARVHHLGYMDNPSSKHCLLCLRFRGHAFAGRQFASGWH
jgi:hypothetical protein